MVNVHGGICADKLTLLRVDKNKPVGLPAKGAAPITRAAAREIVRQLKAGLSVLVRARRAPGCETTEFRIPLHGFTAKHNKMVAASEQRRHDPEK